MEIKQYFSIVQRWAWLLILGLLLGGVSAFGFSASQTPIYQASTRVQVMSAPSSGGSSYAYWNDQQLAQTYSETITTRPMMDAVGERLGYPVFSGQVRVQLVANTQLIDIRVTDADPTHTAEIANTLVDVFSQKNGEQQSARFSESEQSLQAQIQQVESQIVALQTRSSQASTANSQENIKKAEDEIARLEKELLVVQAEINALQSPTPLPGFFVAPTLSPDQRLQLNEKELHLKQLQNTYDLYQQIYTNLVVLGDNKTISAITAEQEQIQSTLALYQQIRANLIASYENIRLARLNSTTNIISIEPALVPSAPIGPNTFTNTLLGAVVGLMLAAGIIFLIEYLDDTLKSAEQIYQVLNLPVIGFIGEMEHNQELPYVSENPRSPISEAFRTLRANLEFAAVDQPIKTLLVVSAHPEEGKSTTAINLAISIAQSGKRVLLIDADLRRPRVHRYLDMPNRSGLSDLFRAPIPIEEVMRPWKEGLSLLVLTSGGIPPNSADLLASERMAAILAMAQQFADIVIVDAPPFLVSDASILASRMDGVLLVIQPGKTPRDAAVSTIEQLNRSGARVLGVVLNRIPRNRPYYYGGYRYYSGYYKGEENYYGDTLHAYSENQHGKNGKLSWLGMGRKRKRTETSVEDIE